MCVGSLSLILTLPEKEILKNSITTLEMILKIGQLYSVCIFTKHSYQALEIVFSGAAYSILES